MLLELSSFIRLSGSSFFSHSTRIIIICSAPLSTFSFSLLLPLMKSTDAHDAIWNSHLVSFHPHHDSHSYPIILMLINIILSCCWLSCQVYYYKVSGEEAPQEPPVAVGILKGHVDLQIASPSSLSIKNATTEMQGSYSCHVITQKSKSQNEAFLIVILGMYHIFMSPLILLMTISAYSPFVTWCSCFEMPSYADHHHPDPNAMLLYKNVKQPYRLVENK